MDMGGWESMELMEFTSSITKDNESEKLGRFFGSW